MGGHHRETRVFTRALQGNYPTWSLQPHSPGIPSAAEGTGYGDGIGEIEPPRIRSAPQMCDARSRYPCPTHRIETGALHHHRTATVPPLQISAGAPAIGPMRNALELQRRCGALAVTGFAVFALLRFSPANVARLNDVCVTQSVLNCFQLLADLSEPAARPRRTSAARCPVPWCKRPRA